MGSIIHMQGAMTHHIGRITVDLKAPDADRARDLQQEASVLCRTRVPEALAELFDEMAGNRVIRLDRLEVVLDPFKDADGFRSNFVSNLSAGIRETLQDALDRTPSAMEPDKQPKPDVFPMEWKAADLFLNVIEHGTVPWTTQPNGFDLAVQAVPDLLHRSREFREALLLLLKGASHAEKRLATQFKPRDFSRIIGALAQLPEPWIFEVHQTVEKLFKTFDPGTQVRLNTHYAILKAVVHPSGSEESFAIASFAAALEMIIPARPFALDHHKGGFTIPDPSFALDHHFALPDPPFTPDQQNIFIAGARDLSKGFSERLQHLFQRALANVNPAHGQSVPDLLHRDATVYGDMPDDLKLSRGFPVDSPSQGAYPSIIDPGRPGTTEQPSPSKVKDKADKGQIKPWEKEKAPHTPLFHGDPGEDARAKAVAVQTPRGHLETSVSQKQNPAPGKIDSGCQAPSPPWLTPAMEVFHIHNAGVVLLAPFFPSVFRDLNYLNKENQFVDDKAQIRAIHLTELLVTGRNYPAESDLLLNKILCGLDPAEPLERFLSLDEKEHAVAMDLLVSAIGHWKSLKNTSAPVFRQTFLRHFGILDKQDKTWRLRIERTTIDILIDTLPWTISVIKHPWMHRPVMVEW